MSNSISKVSFKNWPFFSIVKTQNKYKETIIYPSSQLNLAWKIHTVVATSCLHFIQYAFSLYIDVLNTF